MPARTTRSPRKPSRARQKGPPGPRLKPEPGAAAAGRAKAQHFLAAGSPYIDLLLEAAKLQPGETVVDIGAGGGAITRLLAPAVAPAGRVVAVEHDPQLADSLRIAGWDGVEVVEGDILTIPLPRPMDAVVANPPFRIIPPVLRRLLDHGFGRAFLLTPLELAQRLTAAPKTEHYGKLTIQIGLRAKVELLFPVPRRAFEPRPEVPAAAIKVTPKPIDDLDLDLLDAVLKDAWDGRKLPLRRALSMLGPDVGLPPKAVQEALTMCSMLDRTFFDVSPWEYGNFTKRLQEAKAERAASKNK